MNKGDKAFFIDNHFLTVEEGVVQKVERMDMNDVHTIRGGKYNNSHQIIEEWVFADKASADEKLKDVIRRDIGTHKSNITRLENRLKELS